MHVFKKNFYGKIVRKKLILAILVFFFFNTFLLHDYGMNWDEPTHYIRGQAFLRYFLTGKKDYNDLPKLRNHYPKIAGVPEPKGITYPDDRYFRRSIYQFSGEKGYLSFSYFANGENGDVGHPPANDILASFSNYVFYQKLGLMGDVESYHLFTVFVSSLLVAGLFLFTASEFGLFAGIVATLSLVLYPLFFSESHFNIKDPVESALYAMAIMTAYKGFVKEKSIWVFVSAVFAGLAFGTKLNIVFGLATILLWFLVYQWKKISAFQLPVAKRLLIPICLYPVIMLSILFAFWPFLWQQPIHNFLVMLAYYKNIGYGTVYQSGQTISIFGINTYAIQWILYSTPLVTLLLSLLGIVYCLKNILKRKNKLELLILLWLTIPIARVSIPHAGIYGGARQIMEYIPAMSILAGIGATYIVRLFNCYIVGKRQWNNKAMKQFFPQIVLLLLFLPIILKLISIHPNENVYFNPLIGGLKGAEEKDFPDWGVTLGSVYLQGMNWINSHAQQNANVGLVQGLLSAVPRIKIRPDINFSERYYSGNLKKGEYLMEVTDYQWNFTVPLEKRKYLETLQPVYTVNVDGVPILTVWKNDGAHAKRM